MADARNIFKIEFSRSIKYMLFNDANIGGVGVEIIEDSDGWRVNYYGPANDGGCELAQKIKDVMNTHFQESRFFRNSIILAALRGGIAYDNFEHLIHNI